ncbi:phage minor head protein [Vibrio scophthalmi]|uniref:Putative capsid assembly protein n=1 Tax=Vibrio scophthalmi TaxID=45658 RepID=A0A1E3WMD2_9VIBR|nr:phage minor head protein [Vibrio scophthalmi]ODS10933.1 putative capsid assembly protein [Vibrio scophthalmi]
MNEDLIPEEALNYLLGKGIQPAFDYRDVWRSEHNHMFTVAKMMNEDMLSDVKIAVEKALAEGMSFKEFKDYLKPYLVKQGWWGQVMMDDPLTQETKQVQLGSNARLKTIYRTNMKTARAAGQWERIERTKESHPYLLYELGPSREHRPDHVKWNGLMLPADDSFWHTHYPSNGWGCNCRVRQVSQAQAEKLKQSGISARVQEVDESTGLATGRFTSERIDVHTTAPQIKTRKMLNKRTGEVESVPEGIDPGWNYNPGINRTPFKQNN